MKPYIQIIDSVNEREMYVFIAHIVLITQEDEVTRINFVNKDPIWVDETAKEIIQLLNKANK